LDLTLLILIDSNAEWIL